jgi:hypothetical protein
MHKSGDWLERHGLWRNSHYLGDLAQTAIDTRFFLDSRDRGSCGRNYDHWKQFGLTRQIDGDEKPLLVQYPDYVNIIDGFGRLLPYMTHVREGMAFQPFQAYFARPVK